MAERFFEKVAENVLQASEQIVNRMEEGFSVLTTGDLPKGSQQEDTMDSSNEQEFDLDDIDIDNLSEEEIQRIMAEEMMQNSPLDGIADSVIGDIVAGQAGPRTPLDEFHAFRSAITWSETFILSLVLFQIFVFCLCLWVSRKDRGLTPRVFVMLLIGILVRSAEWLNGIGARTWEKFSTQNYFDKRGIFIGIMFCGPLLLDCLFMLFMFVREAGQLLVVVKKEELKKKKEKKVKSEDKKRSKKTRKQD